MIRFIERVGNVVERVGNVVADYTVGTVIVMVHMVTADRAQRRLVLPPS